MIVILTLFYLLIVWLDFMPLFKNKKKNKKSIIFYSVVLISTYSMYLIFAIFDINPNNPEKSLTTLILEFLHLK